MIKGYYFITDAILSKAGNISDVKNAIACGVGVVQYRNKTGSAKKICEEALELKRLCKNKALFIVNDRTDIALAIGADGVHLGQDDMPYATARKMLGNKIIGITVHNIEEAISAQKMGADYIGLSPIFSTATKQDAGKSCGISMIKKIKEACKIPLVAIGGIDLENAEQVISAGADGICAISAVVAKENAGEEIKKFQGLF